MDFCTSSGPWIWSYGILQLKKHQEQSFQVSHCTGIYARAQGGALMGLRSESKLEAEAGLEEKWTEHKLSRLRSVPGKAGIRYILPSILSCRFFSMSSPCLSLFLSLSVQNEGKRARGLLL